MMDCSKHGKMRAESCVLERVFYFFESSFHML